MVFVNRTEVSLTQMNSAEQARLSRSEIRKILRRNKGSQVEVAAAAKVSKQTVNTWLAGRMTSENVARAAEAKAVECLEVEKVRKSHHAA